VALIAIIIFGSAGVLLFLASPTPVFSASIDTSGLLASQSFNVTIGFPKSQMQVSFELISTPLGWNFRVFNSTDLVHGPTVPSNSPGTYATTWLDAPPGVYRITVEWSGLLTVRMTVFARGPPFTA